MNLVTLFSNMVVGLLLIFFSASPSVAESNETQALLVRGSNTCAHFSARTGTSGLFDGWACDSKDDNQQFFLEQHDDDWFAIVSSVSNLCVTVPTGTTINHVATTFKPCTGADHQLWRKDFKSENWYQLIAKHSKKCLDLEHGIKRNGTAILHWTCHPPSIWQYENQLFRDFH